MSDLLSDDLPAGSRRVFAAFVIVGGLSCFAYFLDLSLSDSIASDIAAGVIPRHAPIFKSILENLIAGAVAAFVLALTYRWVVNWIDPADRVLEISSALIGYRLILNARRTKNYVFIGNTATFVTASILPVLVGGAKRKGQVCHVDLFLIDPLDKVAVDSYAVFKTSVAHSASVPVDENQTRWILPNKLVEPERTDVVQGKILAAIYLTALASLNSGVASRIYLRRGFTPFRVDLSDREVVLTQESPSESAVAFSARGHFYGWYQKEADSLKGQCESFDFGVDRDKLLKLRLTHPSGEKTEIEKALLRFVQAYPYFQGLIANPCVFKVAAMRIASPSHSYEK